MKHGDSILPAKFRPRVPVRGTLKIGQVETVAGKLRPKKLDFMRFCGPSATAAGQYPDDPEMAEVNKKKPTSFTIELISDDPEVNLEVAYVMGGRGHILCRGNGERAERRLDPKGNMGPDNPFREITDACGEGCAFFRQGKCKLGSTLRFRIPGHTDLGTLWTFRTTSWNTAQDLLGAQQNILQLTGGVLARIPLKLYMTEQRRQALTETGRTSSNFWTLGLAFEGTEQELVNAVREARRLKEEMASTGVPTLEDRLKAETPAILAEDLPENEELAIAAEFFPSNGPTVAQNPAPEPQPVEAPEPGPDDAPEASTPEANSAEAPPAAPAPAANGITKSQHGLLLNLAGKVPGVDNAALESKMAGMSKKEASDLISAALKSAASAFKNLGVVA